MATTARELLILAARHGAQSETDLVAAEVAITALGHAGRLLRHLAPTDQARRRSTSPTGVAAGQLAAACESVAAAWPSRSGRLPDLVGAGCDIISRALPLPAPQQWAITVELAQTARRCAERAMRYRPYAQLPILRSVVAAGVAVEQQAALRPSLPGASWVLNVPVPAAAGCTVPRPGWLLLDSTAALLHTLRAEVAHGPLPIAAALATAAVGEEAARRCVTRADHHTREVADSMPWRHAPAGWQVVHTALVRFDDGHRRRRSVEPSPTVRAAQDVQQAISAFDSTDRADSAARPDHDGMARALPGVSSLLPALAAQLDEAARGWGRQRTLFAHARDLVRSEDLVPELLANATVPVGTAELAPVVAAIRIAGRLSQALAIETTRGLPGCQPRPIGFTASGRPLDADARWAARLAARAHQLSERSATPQL